MLPGETEWEKAARGGSKIPVSPASIALSQGIYAASSEQGGISNPKPDRVYPWEKEGEISDLCNISDSGIETTNACGCFSKGKSPYGVEEMSGNVLEWTRSSYANEGDDAKDRLPNISPNVSAVLRGGSFDFASRFARSACRDWVYPNFRNWYFGFRVVASPFDSEL
jgi:formylglycine-generating enzyme required for sulfatase activity